MFKLVLADPRPATCETLEVIGIAHSSKLSIVNDPVDMRKLSARWVPPLLTNEHKFNFLSTSNVGFFTVIRRNFTSFLSVNETWIHHNKPRPATADAVGLPGK